MNEELLEQAKLIVPDVRKLIVGVSRRARELAEGARTMVTVSPGAEKDYLDLALREVVEGKVIIKSAEEDSEAEK
ncbi:MAG: DNA-directed RNA polymerase subunit omega [Victivallales bacterium]|nr:DNA-directed RNA polymerase subunit omega [Victivallales bacterium]